MHGAMRRLAADETGEILVALCCSGATASQWRQLAGSLDAPHSLIVPEHYGCPATGPWPGERTFSLADEAARTVDLMDRAARKVHLVGHSYGGGVALHAALARPHRVASLSLYEPSAFHLLTDLGAAGAKALAEILALAHETARRVCTGDNRRAAACFVDYWGGAGAWAALRPDQQAALVRWVPKAPLDFAALVAEPTAPAAYAGIEAPVLLMRGEFAPPPTRLVAELLAALLPDARAVVIEGAGHMGPFTHCDEVGARIAEHALGSAAQPRPAPSGA